MERKKPQLKKALIVTHPEAVYAHQKGREAVLLYSSGEVYKGGLTDIQKARWEHFKWKLADLWKQFDGAETSVPVIKKRIFLYCLAMGAGSGMVNGSAPGGDVMGYALAEDGACLAMHLSSNASFSKHDMGLTSDWKHEIYEKYYPLGFELVWVDEDQLDTHEGFNAAFALNKLRRTSFEG